MGSEGGERKKERVNVDIDGDAVILEACVIIRIRNGQRLCFEDFFLLSFFCFLRCTATQKAEQHTGQKHEGQPFFLHAHAPLYAPFFFAALVSIMFFTIRMIMTVRKMSVDSALISGETLRLVME